MTGRGLAWPWVLGGWCLLGMATGAGAAETVGRPSVPTVVVSRFQVTGSTVFAAERLRALVADGEGRALTLDEIEALAGRITQHYREQGYLLARAYVPVQEVREGVVEIAVLEGRVGRIEVRGARRHAPRFLEAYAGLDPPVFHAGRHERSLLLLGDLPGLVARSTLVPGVEVGTTDVLLDVEEARLLGGNVEANNFGSRTTGRERFGVELELRSPLGRGDLLAVRGVLSRRPDELWLVRVAYSLPVGRWGTRAGLAYMHVEARPGEELRELDVAGAGNVVSLTASHPFLRSRALSVHGLAGFDYKDFTTAVLGERLSRDRLRVLTAGVSVDAVDGWRGRTEATAMLQEGLGGFLGGLRADDPNASRAGAGGAFTKMTAGVARLQRLVGPTALLLRAGGQWASTALVASEQIAVGGVGSVRGYPVAEALGDHGYTVSAELRWSAPGFADVPAFGGRTWGDVLQVVGFVDHGAATLRDARPGDPRVRRLSGGGVGVRFGVLDTVFLRLEYARRIGGPPPSDGRENVIYFQAVKWF